MTTTDNSSGNSSGSNNTFLPVNNTLQNTIPSFFSSFSWVNLSDEKRALFDQVYSEVDSSNTQSVRGSAISIKYESTIADGKIYTIAVGYPSDVLSPRGAFGYSATAEKFNRDEDVSNYAEASTEANVVKLSTSSSSTVVAVEPAIMIKLNSIGAPQENFSIASLDLPWVSNSKFLLIYGGTTITENNEKVATSSKELWMFGTWDATVHMPPNIISKNYLQFISDAVNATRSDTLVVLSKDKKTMTGWLQLVINEGSPLPTPRTSAAVACLRSSNTDKSNFAVVVLGGVNGVNDKEPVGNIKTPTMKNYVKAIQTLESKVSGLQHPIDSTRVSLAVLSYAVKAVCAEATSLGINASRSDPEILEFLDTSTETVRKAQSSESNAEPDAHVMFSKVEDTIGRVLDIINSGPILAYNAASSESSVIRDFIVSLQVACAAAIFAADEILNIVKERIATVDSRLNEIIKSACEGIVYIAKHTSVRKTTQILNDAWIYKTETGSWESIGVPDSFLPRFGTEAIAGSNNGEVLFFGGIYELSVVPLREVWKLQIINKTWKLIFSDLDYQSGLPPLPNLDLRHAAMIRATNGDILLHGGFSTCLDAKNLMPLEFNRLEYLSADFQNKCVSRVVENLENRTRLAVAAGALSKSVDGVPSNEIWIFSTNNTSNGNGYWVRLNPVVRGNPTTVVPTSNAFHSMFCNQIETIDSLTTESGIVLDVPHIMRICIVGGVDITTDRVFTRQKTLDQIVREDGSRAAELEIDHGDYYKFADENQIGENGLPIKKKKVKTINDSDDLSKSRKKTTSLVRSSLILSIFVVTLLFIICIALFVINILNNNGYNIRIN